jgi:uncharacterized membrane protein YidH (DUF202 family)
MRNPLMILGVLFIVVGIVIASGLMKYQDKDKVIDLGKVELEATREKEAPVNWGYILLGVGAVVLVGGALIKKP